MQYNHMKAIDLTHVYEKYKDLWVTFTDKYKVISADKDIKKAYDKAVKKGYEHPRLFKIPKENLPFIG